MHSLRPSYRALVIGATGGIGSAFVARLEADPRCAAVVGLSRTSEPPLDHDRPDTLGAAADALRSQGPFQLILCATGALHLRLPDGGEAQPEKRLAELDAQTLAQAFAVNSIGPALVLRHFHALLPRDERALFGVLSARVGSIGDNRKGGWYGYRASKAALNMLVKTAAIEIARQRPLVALAALHPGTVATPLSARVIGIDGPALAPAVAADSMLAVLDGLKAEDSGCFRAWDGATLPW
ncbi:MAG: SDR family NAD(P)-dependent oxidoreductase [Chitinophagaceae bacterium]|nr:SDR family NAD(P)-dependent oxidoreductase [Rubrivivax sp.]